MSNVALITGASLGFGRAVADALAARGWSLVVDARRPGPLLELAASLRAATANGSAADATAGRSAAEVVALPGDVADPAHRAELAAAVRRLGRLDLLLNNASVLGPSPQPPLAGYPLDELERVYQVNVFAPLALYQLVLPQLVAAGGAVVNVSSDAAVQAYPGWGGYGSAKAALDQLTAVLAAEQAEPAALAVYAFDPGDMRTELHQQAFPGEDISDRPEPQTVVPALLRLLDTRQPAGRYRAADLAAGAARAASAADAAGAPGAASLDRPVGTRPAAEPVGS
jgi:NAD(P)-dependent dehydrogenase (short-subunit alcohol dehydrogenase family)